VRGGVALRVRDGDGDAEAVSEWLRVPTVVVPDGVRDELSDVEGILVLLALGDVVPERVGVCDAVWDCVTVPLRVLVVGGVIVDDDDGDVVTEGVLDPEGVGPLRVADGVLVPD
jgi:hypothetical protein